MFHHKTIIRESHPVLSQNYISSTNVRVVIDVFSVMAEYFDVLCVCLHTHINNDTHIGTRNVILGNHWMWLPDDGFM